MTLENAGPENLGPENLALLGASAIVLAVLAGAFAIAGAGRPEERHWGWWLRANAVIALSLVCYGLVPLAPRPLVNLPDLLLVAGFALRWQAARAFSGRTTPMAAVAAPVAAAALLAAMPLVLGLHGLVFAAVNLVLAALALLAAFEFFRDHDDGRPSRLGLVAAYVVIAVSFGARVGQGLIGAHSFAPGLQDDPALTLHLLVGLLHAVAAGAFALSLAYETGAAALKRAATRDALTGLLNRGAFEAEVRRRLAGSGEAFALVFLDIDHFKRINDRYGHAAGDEAIRVCATVCGRHVRDGDLSARIGGEEFAVLLSGVGPAEATAVAERIRAELAATRVRAGGRSFSMTVSAGIGHAGLGPCDFDTLMRVADGGLYRAKQGGRDRVEMAA